MRVCVKYRSAIDKRGPYSLRIRFGMNIGMNNTKKIYGNC